MSDPTFLDLSWLHDDAIGVLGGLRLGKRYSVSGGLLQEFTGKFIGLLSDDDCKLNGGCYLCFAKDGVQGYHEMLWSRGLIVEPAKEKE